MDPDGSGYDGALIGVYIDHEEVLVVEDGW